MLNSSYTIEHLIQHLINTLLSSSLKKILIASTMYKVNQREANLLLQESHFVRAAQAAIQKIKK
jgi:hypothetical protein